MTPLEDAQEKIDAWIQQGDVTKPLILSWLGLTTLPALPPTLQELWCAGNKLTSLPTLPSTLQSLWCDNNQLTSLPSLPPTLEELFCQNNQLTSLPTLPSNLQLLWCNNNQLTSLHELLPTLWYTLWWLKCYDNPLETPILIHETLEEYFKRVETIRRKRIQERSKAIREELVSTVWHPTRVGQWIERYGQDFEECV